MEAEVYLDQCLSLSFRQVPGLALGLLPLLPHLMGAKNTKNTNTNTKIQKTWGSDDTNKGWTSRAEQKKTL